MGTFPEHVKALIMLDLIKPVSRRVDELVERTRNSVEMRLDLEAKASTKPEKVYPTYEKALEKLNRAAVEAYCTNPLYEYRAVPGPHHVHLNNPEIVAGPINTFLERHNNLDGPKT